MRVNDLHLDPTGRYLTAGVYGRGVWVLDFKAKAVSSSGPGEKGEPEKPRTDTEGRMPATGANAAVSVVAVLLAALSLVARRVRRRA